MINARVLELLLSPAELTQEDLKVIPEEIKKQPYIQSIRALYLYGVHKHQPENYQKVLSETAAFTTDKKILYQFINKKSQSSSAEVEQVIPITEAAVSSEDNTPVTSRFNVDKLPNVTQFELSKPVYVNGKLNRILFEGEENLLSRAAEKIDIEATLESGNIVLQDNFSKDAHLPNFETKEIEPDIAETLSDVVLVDPKVNGQLGTQQSVLESSEIEKEVESTDHSAELSYHGLEDFLPEVKFTPTKITQEAPKTEPKLDRHALEMQRLIAEVEAKIKAGKKDKKANLPVDEEPASQDINFSDEIPFLVQSTEQPKPQVVQLQKFDAEPKSGWKPMHFQSSVPDALIGKIATPKVELLKPVTELKPAVDSHIEDQEEQKITKEDVKESNIPTFINTWHSWLQLDKKSPAAPQVDPIVAVEKFDPIEKFIESEPKISRLTEDSNFIVKERNDDISHLMTETLAKLYVEQKLYAKAIRAFETLSAKYPERKAYFAERIRQVKDMRQGK